MTSFATSHATNDLEALDRDVLAAVDRSGIAAHFQPIVDMPRCEVTGYEALARIRERPELGAGPLLDAARRAGRLPEIEAMCRRAALDGAVEAGLDGGLALFVNVEPAASPHVELASLRDAAMPVVAELTERDLLARPATLLAAVAELRRSDVLIALDDVGAHPDSLALIAFLQPDVVKLDLDLVHSEPAGVRARTLMAVMAYCERTGAQLLAEGIESERHLERARALGAQLGQGFLFGRPGPLPGTLPAPVAADDWRLHRVDVCTPATPFDLVRDSTELRVATKSLLYGLALDIEHQAGNDSDPPAVLAAFQHVRHFGAHTAAKYARYARNGPLVAVFGTDLPREPVAGVRGVSLQPNDPLLAEWTLVVLGAHYAGALIAREVEPPSGPRSCDDDDRRFEFVLTHQRDLVAAAGRSMLARITGAPTGRRPRAVS